MQAEGTGLPRPRVSETCPICGEKALTRRRGRFVFRWPEGFVRQASVFRDAEWDQCGNCGEQILPYRLLRRLEVRAATLRPHASRVQQGRGSG